MTQDTAFVIVILLLVIIAFLAGYKIGQRNYKYDLERKKRKND